MSFPLLQRQTGDRFTRQHVEKLPVSEEKKMLTESQNSSDCFSNLTQKYASVWLMDELHKHLFPRFTSLSPAWTDRISGNSLLLSFVWNERVSGNEKVLLKENLFLLKVLFFIYRCQEWGWLFCTPGNRMFSVLQIIIILKFCWFLQKYKHTTWYWHKGLRTLRKIE